MVTVHADEVHIFVTWPPEGQSVLCSTLVVLVHLRRNRIDEVPDSLGVSQILDREAPEADELLFGGTLRTPPRPCLGMLMIWTEDDRNQLAVRTLEVVGEVCTSVKPLEILCPCRMTFGKDAPDHLVAGIIP